MAVERGQRIQEDTSAARRNLYCDVGPLVPAPCILRHSIECLVAVSRVDPRQPAVLSHSWLSAQTCTAMWVPVQLSCHHCRLLCVTCLTAACRDRQRRSLQLLVMLVCTSCRHVTSSTRMRWRWRRTSAPTTITIPRCFVLGQPLPARHPCHDFCAAIRGVLLQEVNMKLDGEPCRSGCKRCGRRQRTAPAANASARSGGARRRSGRGSMRSERLMCTASKIEHCTETPDPCESWPDTHLYDAAVVTHLSAFAGLQGLGVPALPHRQQWRCRLCRRRMPSHRRRRPMRPLPRHRRQTTGRHSCHRRGQQDMRSPPAGSLAAVRCPAADGSSTAVLAA